jgi:O-antigen ligase
MVLPVFDRQGIAFNLSGPLSLAVATMFFSTLKLTPSQLKRILIAVLAPIIGVGFLATFLTITAESITFTGSSIKATSAGVGPNQMSSILGLGAFVAFLYLFIDRKHKALRILMIGCTIWLLAQAALTFARGGVWGALGAIGVAVFYLLRNRRARAVFVSVGTVIFIVGYFLVFPALEDFTESTLGLRFKSFEVTGREKIIQGDLLAFQEHPWLGVGPDQSKIYHSLYFRSSSAHTEYTRLLAEHGIMGMLALLTLVWMGLKRFSRRSDPASKAYSASFTVWALLFMLHSAMRLVAPSLMFGLAFSVFTVDSDTDG